MATMVKEKRREKKKHKEKTASRSSTEREQPSVIKESKEMTAAESLPNNVVNIAETSVELSKEVPEAYKQVVDTNIDTQKLSVADTSPGIEKILHNTDRTEITELTSSENVMKTDIEMSIPENKLVEQVQKELLNVSSIGNTYQDLSSRLERIAIPELNPHFDLEEFANRLENPIAYMRLENKNLKEQTSEIKDNIQKEVCQKVTENVVASAPVLEEQESTQYYQQPVEIITVAPCKVQCMPLEQAIMLYGGKEMAAVRAMSEREEAIVEAGPMSGPEHPLVDLLSTFRSSLIAVERERNQLSKGYIDEEKFRNTLWKIETRHVDVSEDCSCGATVQLRATYQHAELLKERLPVAKLKLEGLLRDVQDSYCHHQHTALLTHFQIEELIAETVKSNKNVIREALALVLQSLRLSDNAPSALATSLQRWAAVLSAALLDGRDLRQLLLLLHHLFRQTRSVRWAARVVRSYIRAGDRSEAAQCIAVLDLLLSRPGLEPALECTEDANESWEEMDERGGAGAVSEGALREQDLGALLHAFPARELVGRLVLCTREDISQAREHDWGDSYGGRGVLKSCCGVRAFLATLQRAITSHPTYTRLHGELRTWAVKALHALAGLHLHTRDTYAKDLEDKISAELEACFCSGFRLLGPGQSHRLPASLLREDAAQEYCTALMAGLHDKCVRPLSSMSLELPVEECGARVRAATRAAAGRLHDNDLARTLLDFLLQTGLKRKPVPCKGACEVTARELLSPLLASHPYLHTVAFHMLADIYQVEVLDPSSVGPLSPGTWRPTPGEVRQVLEDWEQRCPALLQHLLLGLDYTPHSGLSLQTQLTIGSWLCRWLKGDSKRPAPPEWAWSVLRRLRVHRSHWGGSYDSAPPDPTPDDLFSSAYAVLASSWGHCIPLICSEGVSALCLVAHARPADVVHCLGPIMLLMAHSPESVSLTPKFSELFSVLLKSGPTMVQRALGLGPVPGTDLLLGLILHQVDGNTVVSRSSLVSAWLHALWRPCLSSGPLLDTLLLATREWQLFDGHSTQLLQDKNAIEHLSNAVRHVATAPMLCECVLRTAHAAREARAGLCARLLDVLHLQRIAGDRIHVDNALKQIGANMSSEDLVIYRTATALIYAPISPPAHLTLWALFFYLYLQRPPTSMADTTPPIGPLFFSGLLKSRVLAQLRRKLQESLTHHHNEGDALKQSSREETPQPPPRTKHANEKCLEDGVLPILTQRDLTGESSDSSDSDSVEESEQEDKTETSETSETKKKNDASLLKYHLAAESMFKELLRWLDEADKTRAMPHHADVARFMPEQVLAAAWSRELQSRRPPLVEESSSPRAPPAPPPTPFQATMATLLSIKDCSRRRSRRFDIRSPLEDVDFKDARSLLSLVDKYLANIEALAEEWSTETARISSLDSGLWELVTALRVRRPLPPVRKQCPHRKCKPLTIHIPEQEWCISSGAERGIQDNRRSAQALVRRLARPRPHAARSAATLTAVARRVRSAECAARLCERAWRCAGAARPCAPAHSVLTAFVQVIADTWLCHDGKLCAELLARWGNSCSTGLQETLCGALVSPRRLSHSQWPAVYRALLPARLPPHTAFSYLSKFEMARWSESADPTQRRELLDALLAAAQRWGPRPDDEYHVLLELIGVHTATLINAQELCALTVRCARASAARTLPPAFWTSVTRAAHCHARDVPFDQLGHLLRELGVVWWEARSRLSGKLQDYSDYAPRTADLLHVLHRAFAAAATALSYAPERVALYSWSALQESWAPWICPHPSCPLLGRDAHADMLKHLVDSIQQIMLDCPGTEEKLLHQIFEWTVQTYLNGSKSQSQECRIQLSTLLEQFRGLPWTEHQWFRASCLQCALQVCASKDQEVQTWCGNTWRGTLAETWLQGTTDEQLAPTLASLLYLFTSMTQADQVLEEATRLPWWRLPSPALEEALERFFVQNHSPAHAYHDLPAFRVLLFASELYASPACPPSAAYSAVSRVKRTTAVSRWVCAACAPTLIDHVPGHSRRILDVLTQIAPYLERSQGEIEELLGRAVVVMCMEPAAAAAIPVWQQWVASTPARMVAACVSAASVLTAFEYFASLAESAIRAHLTNKECGGWPAVFPRVHQSPWHEAAPLCARARLHVAYAVLRTHAHTHDMTRTAVLALLAASVNFIENEAIIAVWICTCCRIARECGDCGGEAGECSAGARRLLARWGEEQRRSLLKLVTLQADSGAPTAQHRLLCRLAQCIVTNSDATVRSYEAACTTVLGTNPDVLAWGRSPRPKHLPRLAVRLYPHAEKYFQDELDLAPEDV